MSDITDTLKIVEELNNEEDKKKKFKFIFQLVLSTVVYLFISKVFSNLEYIIDAANVSAIDEVFTNFALIVLIFIFSFLAVEGLIFLCKLIHKLYLHQLDYFWNDKSTLEDWQFQGNIAIDTQEDAIHIIQSDLGMILKDREWKDYEMSFDFKIPSIPKYSPRDEENNQLRRGFGIIYRAKTLGEYFMLKIDINGYHPHVRHVLWENNGPIFKTSLKITDLNNWINAKISVKNNYVAISIEDDKFDFLIPTHSNITRDTNIEKSYTDLKFEEKPYSKVPFRDQGTIGFRSAFYEEVYIKNLKIRHKFYWKFLKWEWEFFSHIRFRNVRGN